MSVLKNLFCREELAEVESLRGKLAMVTEQLRITELTAARLKAENRELVYQLDGVRKQVRALRRRTRRK